MFKKSKSSHRFLRQRQEDDNNRGVVFRRLMLYKPIAHLHSISSRKRHVTEWYVILLATWFSFQQLYLLIIQNAKFSSKNCWVSSLLIISKCFHCNEEGNLLGVIVKITNVNKEFLQKYYSQKYSPKKILQSNSSKKKPPKNPPENFPKNFQINSKNFPKNFQTISEKIPKILKISNSLYRT